MFLNYFALAVLLLGLTAVFYTFIYIHDIPYQIAKRRDHPQKEAIHVAGWLSLFTFHAIWPIIYIWAVSRQADKKTEPDGDALHPEDFSRRLDELERKLSQLEALNSSSNQNPGVS